MHFNGEDSSTGLYGRQGIYDALESLLPYTMEAKKFYSKVFQLGNINTVLLLDLQDLQKHIITPPQILIKVTLKLFIDLKGEGQGKVP